MESKKTFKNLYFVAFLFSSILLWGCQKKTNLNNGLTGFGNGVCQAGQVQTTNGQCLDQFGCPAGQGWDGSQCVPGVTTLPGQVLPGAPSAYASSIQVTNRGLFEDFLGNVGGVCDTQLFSFSIFGPDPHDCDSYSSKGYAIMEFYPQGANFNNGNIPAYVTIGAGATSPADGAFGGNGGIGHLAIPLNMTAFPINNNAGFELQAQGGFFSGSAATISFRTESGSIGGSSDFQVIFSYNQQEFARAFVSRQ